MKFDHSHQDQKEYGLKPGIKYNGTANLPNSMQNDNALEQVMRVGSPQHAAYAAIELMNLSNGGDNYYDRSEEDSDELQLTTFAHYEN